VWFWARSAYITSRNDIAASVSYFFVAGVKIHTCQSLHGRHTGSLTLQQSPFLQFELSRACLFARLDGCHQNISSAV
jgi:hypothetical protein